MLYDPQRIDREVLERLEDRLKRGIPKWEQEFFIEQVVPLLVASLRRYMRYDTQVRSG